uniref:Uncharacterized protein n=1 Tax=Euplotes crassus TaxID=5936 RepID=A0A7S3K6M3_EUPCR|mmetsp:Transcript_11722/g.11670  ORF Transcript_11722/g.11670 Transcript_11722/m.11670 type:complete len:203 (+) Transcript_11722:35-643(+)
MKLLVIAVLTLAIVSASADVAQLVKDASSSLKTRENIAIEGETTSPTGVDASFYLRFDGENNIFSYTLGFVDTAFGKFTHLTYAWDFTTSKSYIHTTGDDFCMDDEFENPMTEEYESFNDWISHYGGKTPSTEKKEIDGVMYEIQTLEYDEENKFISHMVLESGDFTKLEGMFLGDDFSVDITHAEDFECIDREEHIPEACP